MGTLTILRGAEGTALLRRGATAAKTVAADTTFLNLTGTVWISAWGKVNTGFTVTGGTPTLALGIAGQTGILLAATDAANLDAIDDLWADTGTADPAEAVSAAVHRGVIISAGNDVLVTVAGTGSITTGALIVQYLWRPISTNADVSEASV